MERMKHTGDYELEKINMLEQECADLEEENKTLREKLSEVTMVADDEKQSIEHILELEEENKKLKEELETATKCSSQEEGKLRNLEKENKKLKERVSELEDVSKDYDTLSKDFIELGEENKNLKEDLANIQCEFGFECDECEFWKREIKKHKPCLIKEEYVFNLGDYDYMILTSTTPQLKIIKKNNKGDSTFTVR